LSKNTIDIRKRNKQKRLLLPENIQFDCAYALSQQIKKERSFINSQHIAAYIPMNGEISPLPIIELAWAMDKSVYLPILMPFLANRLWFAPFTRDSIMRNNRFGIPEPVFHGKQLISATHLDMVLTPLVAFDTQCNRIGMGGGYYDRTFEFLRHRKHWLSPKLVGVAYEFQKTTPLRAQSWDVPLKIVVTEQNKYIRK